MICRHKEGVNDLPPHSVGPPKNGALCACVRSEVGGGDIPKHSRSPLATEDILGKRVAFGGRGARCLLI